eukprot:TRINITY_DN1420_c0_g1_i2.p1 TRINITY_DN1420_c0_g1~~TRINITY_DN1420_c0_g1_i2.p1  ORF type:complete len:293 (-),score=19.41 TRINITY_DN1420_c0_g1_i2:49-927(-)
MDSPPPATKRLELYSKSAHLIYSGASFAKGPFLEYLKGLYCPEAIVVAEERTFKGKKRIHAYIKFERRVHIARIERYAYKGYSPRIKSCKNIQEVLKFCEKPENYVEWGINVKAKLKAINSKCRYLPIMEFRCEHCGQISRVKITGRSEEAIKEKAIPGYREKIERRAVWIYGPANTGKTRWVSDHYPSSMRFNKDQTKLWDGYKQEPVVVIDGLDNAAIGPLLIVWSDRYTFTADTLSGKIVPTYSTLIVTSNYLPKFVFLDRTVVRMVENRFKFYTMGDNYALIPFDLII